MMQTAYSYAKALYSLLVPEEAVRAALESMRGCRQLMEVLANPLICAREKDAVIEKVFPRELHNFLKVICRKGMASQCPEIFQAYETYRKSKEGVLEAVLYYVTKPHDEQLEGICNLIKKEFGVSRVEIKLMEQPELGGGFLLKAGTTEYDWSLRGRLNSLAQQLIRR